MPSLPAVFDHFTLMALGNRPAPRFLQRRRVERFDAEAHRAEAGRVQLVEQIDVEPVEPRLGFERQVEPARLDLVAERDDAVALFGEERIAEDDVRPLDLIAQPLHLVHDVRDRPRAVAGQNPVRAVGAELRAAAAREQRVAAADGAREELEAHPRAIFGDQIPARERQRIEIVDLLADDRALRDDALRQPHDRRFRLAVEDEIAVVGEQLRHLRRRDADEADLDALRAHAIGPRGFVLVIDERREHERDVALHFFAARPLHVVAGARQDGRDVGHVDAGHVVELLLEIRHHRRHARERIEPRSVPADDGVLADEPAIGLQVCEHDSHQSPQSADTTRARRTGNTPVTASLISIRRVDDKRRMLIGGSRGNGLTIPQPGRGTQLVTIP